MQLWQVNLRFVCPVAAELGADGHVCELQLILRPFTELKVWVWISVCLSVFLSVHFHSRFCSSNNDPALLVTSPALLLFFVHSIPPATLSTIFFILSFLPLSSIQPFPLFHCLSLPSS